MISALVGLAVVAFALTVGLVVHRARRGLLASGSLVVLALVCGIALVVMNLSDWPTGSLTSFWTEHSVVAATLSTLLLGGAGFLAFEARDNLEQSRATESLATAAFGGLVDHMLDIDLALAFLVGAEPPDAMQTDGRPLRWLRSQRDELVKLNESDPRQAAGGDWRGGQHEAWREILVDQAIRRVMGGMRDWAPLLTQTRDGTGVLVRIGQLRNQLLNAQRALEASDWAEARQHVRLVRAECQVLALGLELGSGIDEGQLRPGVLTKPSPDLETTHAAAQMDQLCKAVRAEHRRRIGALLAGQQIA